MITVKQVEEMKARFPFLPVEFCDMEQSVIDGDSFSLTFYRWLKEDGIRMMTLSNGDADYSSGWAVLPCVYGSETPTEREEAELGLNEDGDVSFWFEWKTPEDEVQVRKMCSLFTDGRRTNGTRPLSPSERRVHEIYYRINEIEQKALKKEAERRGTTPALAAREIMLEMVGYKP